MSEKRSILDAIKSDIAKSGGNFKNLFRVAKAGQKVRVRFLVDFEEGIEVVLHSKWQGFQHPCLKYKGVECPNCDSSDPDVRTQSHYAWSIYNYETKQVELFFFKAARSTPLSALGAVYETIGDITSQDMVIQRNGEGTDTSYAVIPTGKIEKLKAKVKPFTEQKIFDILFSAFNTVDENTSVEEYLEDAEPVDDEDVEETPKKKVKPKKKVAKVEEEDEGYDEEEEDDDEYDDEDDFDDEEEEEELPPPKKRKAAVKSSKRR